jgi:hypothetical protein
MSSSSTVVWLGDHFGLAHVACWPKADTTVRDSDVRFRAPFAGYYLEMFQSAAAELAIEPIKAIVHSTAEIEDAMTTLGGQAGAGLVIVVRRGQAVASGKRHSIKGSGMTRSGRLPIATPPARPWSNWRKSTSAGSP